MMRNLFLITALLIAVNIFGQETAVLLKEAYNLELKFNEPDALVKYKQVLVNDPSNYKALSRAAELSCSIGARNTNPKDKRLLYESALAFANRAFIVDSNSANSFYLLSLASGKMTEVETENKKKVAFVRDIKIYADKALQLNPNHALTNFIEGKWHYEMVTLNWTKKLAVKTLYGGLPDPSIEKCINYLEKCKKNDPYFVLNYLTLAKAYKENNNAVKMLEVLNQLVKLPKRNFDDAAYIEEGKKMLADEQ
jgi:tetratricopeptide (TPR) repeat protein